MPQSQRDLSRLFQLFVAELGPVGVVALVLGLGGETLDVCICADDDAVEERSMLLLDLHAGDALGAVFGTVRAGPAIARPSDWARFDRLRRHGRRVGLPLLDWFVVGDGECRSLHDWSGAGG
jgi:hypothetical protein